MIFRLILAFLSVLMSASSMAQPAGGVTEKDAEMLKNVLKTQVDAAVKLPVQGMHMIEAGGKTLFVSDNGRIVIVGKIYDMWNNVELKGVGDVDKYAMKIDIGKLGVNLDELKPIVIGNGKLEVVVFVDPNCPHCHKILQNAIRLKQYTFKFIPLPLLGPDSVEKVRKGLCHADKVAVSKALVDNQWEKIPVGEANCGQLPAEKSIILARILGVTSIPFSIAPDGTIYQGVPKDYTAWLDTHSGGVQRASAGKTK